MITFNRVHELFDEINSYPRASGNREPVFRFLCRFAEKNSFEYYTDNEFNIVIKKEASVGMENAPGLILQAHTDMVCVKDDDITHDFTKDEIKSYIEDGYLKAKGTTLGSDNGIAMAIMLAFLESDIRSPKLECVFTTDEETNMIGAKKLDKSILNSKYMINLDEETDKCITVSSAGISDLRLGYLKEAVSESYKSDNKSIVNISLDGLLGGHSGIDIKLGRINAIKLIINSLDNLLKHYTVDVIDIKAGSHMNAIPKDASLILGVQDDEKEEIIKHISEYFTTIKAECFGKEPNMRVNTSVLKVQPLFKLKDSFVDTLIKAINELPCGVIAYDSKITDLVETSANIGRIVSDDKYIKIWISIRSSVDEKLDNYIEKVQEVGRRYNAETELNFKEYGWPVNSKSKLVPFLVKLKEEMFGETPKVSGIHAGLECGTFARGIKDADICAIGPNIYHPHTTGEKTEIKSIEKIIAFLENVLNRFDEIE